MRRTRDQLIGMMGGEIARFQDETAAFDDVAARVLGLERTDLPCMTLLLFGGPASAEELAAALHVRRNDAAAALDRLQLAGYARRCADGERSRVELTEHARLWIEHIWAPLREDGVRLLRAYSTRDLTRMHDFMTRARAVQERQVGKLRKWLELPSSQARKTHRRGGLSPAALRRVQVYVESNLERPIHLADLARRAELSVYHFARAFRTSAGVTPRSFIEQRRTERARRLLEESGDSLADIAAKSGFVSQSWLTTIFKRRTGFTPAQYRRGH